MIKNLVKYWEKDLILNKPMNNKMIRITRISHNLNEAILKAKNKSSKKFKISLINLVMINKICPLINILSFRQINLNLNRKESIEKMIQLLKIKLYE